MDLVKSEFAVQFVIRCTVISVRFDVWVQFGLFAKHIFKMIVLSFNGQ